MDRLVQKDLPLFDYVSIGALTKHLQAVDFSLRYRET